MNSSISTSEIVKMHFCLLLFHRLFPLEHVFMYAVGNQILNRKGQLQ